MSEFDKYYFEEPVNIEDNPFAVKAMTELVEAVLPTRFEYLPHHVVETTTTFAVDDDITAEITAYRQEEAIAYCVVVTECYFWPNDPDTLQFERRTEVEIVPAESKIHLVSDIKGEYDPVGDLLEASGADKSFLDSHTLLCITSRLEKLPGSLSMFTGN